MDKETEILAKTIYGEARGENLSGMEAVACVILNRVKRAQTTGPFWWGKPVSDVCLKPRQFSCWNPDDVNQARLSGDLTADNIFRICRRVAVRALRGLLCDKTKGSTHYHTLDTHPAWASALVPNAQIGNHLFYTCV